MTVLLESFKMPTQVLFLMRSSLVSSAITTGLSSLLERTKKSCKYGSNLTYSPSGAPSLFGTAIKFLVIATPKCLFTETIEFLFFSKQALKSSCVGLGSAFRQSADSKKARANLYFSLILSPSKQGRQASLKRCFSYQPQLILARHLRRLLAKFAYSLCLQASYHLC